jgi:hypothetical protein
MTQTRLLALIAAPSLMRHHDITQKKKSKFEESENSLKIIVKVAGQGG